MLALPLERRFLLGPCLVSGVLLLVYLLPETWVLVLTYERELIAAGEFWRVFTGQFVHLEFTHLILNLLGVGVMYLLFAEHAENGRYLLIVGLLAFASNFGMFVFAPEIARYVGFSGVLYGLFAWGAVLDVIKKVRFGKLLLVGVLLKVTWEYFAGPIMLGPGSTEDLATAAHFYGMLGGLVVALFTIYWGQTSFSDKFEPPH